MLSDAHFHADNLWFPEIDISSFVTVVGLVGWVMLVKISCR